MLPLLTLLSACQPEIEAAPDDSGSSSSEVTCDTEIRSTWPLQGATDAYYRGSIEFTLTELDETATVSTDIPGTQTTRQDGLVIVYTPDEPLEPGQDVTVALNYCRGAPELSFTVSDYGTPLDGGVDLAATAWSLDLSTARFIDAEGLGDIVASYLQNALLLGASSVGADSFTMTMARSDGSGDQDPCSRTTDLPTADFSDAPYFELSGSDVVVDINDVELHLGDLSLAGTFAADGQSIGGVTFTVTGDARDAGAWLGIDPAVICELAESISVPCEPCSDGELYCGTVVASDLEASAIGAPLQLTDELPSDCPDE